MIEHILNMSEVSIIEGFHPFDVHFVGDNLSGDILVGFESETEESTTESKLFFIGDGVRKYRAFFKKKVP